MRMRLSVLALSAALTLAGCSSLIEGPPTPEPFTPPPTPTASVSEDSTATPPTATAEVEAAPDTSATPVPASTFTVERGDVVSSISLQGSIISNQRQSLGFTQPGQIKAIVIEGPGAVKKGDLLATLDDADLIEQIAAAEKAYTQAKSTYDRSLATANLPVRKAEIDLGAARDALEQAKLPATPEQIATARATVQRAAAALAKVRNDAAAVKLRAELIFKDAQKALEQAQAEFGAASVAYEDDKKDTAAEQRFFAAQAVLRDAEKALEQTRLEYETARNNEVALVDDAEGSVIQAQAELDRLLKLPDPFVVKRAERDVQLAQLAVDDARARSSADPELEARVDEAKKALDEITAQQAARSLVAPFDGEVVEIIGQVGATVSAGDPVITILNPAFGADAREIQIDQIDNTIPIREGQSVTISFPGVSDKPIVGKIARLIGDEASGRSAFVSFDAPGIIINPGDPAEIGIELERRGNTLWLPPQAIQNDGTDFVFVDTNGTRKRVEIEIGLLGTDRVEILRGLTEGQVVLAG
jgi:HlyD family secretion protein